ncbi:MAG TPA: rod shape-determining protein MreD [Gemmatimonadaceae bacterium]|jgi:rod shape-determining protein MreD|nr:rod shape-determining protein MreD [Gemmatimonadaceae bacterium]
MTVNGVLRTTIAIVILILLDFSVRPLLGWRAEIDFRIIALLLAAVRMRPGSAAVVGCIMGLIADSLTPHAFGAGALAMTVVGYMASWLKAVFFADNLALNGFFFFAGRWAFAIVYVLAAHQANGVELVQQLLIWAPLSAAATAAAGVVLLVLLRPLLEPATA